ncbi:MAG: hypothetical protein R3282_05825, partial [Rhodothermales bacterium]|nr:hypothetical protein [Rhodothermales bacterium]
ARGQQNEIRGITQTADWPESRSVSKEGRRPKPLDYRDYALLPFIDTLTVSYRFADTLSRPSLHFGIEWMPAEAGILNGRRVAAGRMPEGIMIESIDLLMPVRVRGVEVAELFLPLDTVNLGPSPSMTFVDTNAADWDSVFVDTGAADARAIFSSSFRLGEPRILRIVFSIENSEPDRMSRRDRRYPPSGPPERTVCIPDVDVWISWRSGRARWAPPRSAVTKATRDRRGEIGRTGLVDRTRTDRGYDRPADGETVARSPGEDEGGEATRPAGDSEGQTGDATTSRRGRDRRTGRSGDTGIGDIILPKGDDDDDDDDEDRLYPAALAGAAAVGGIAIFGGTIGYFGSASKAPIGLMSGYVESRGGFLLQVAVNKQVFGKADGPENLVAGVTGFFDAFRSPIQPAIGLGARFTEEGTDDVKSEPSISVGLVGNFGQLVVLAGYDVTTPDFRFGVAVNLRRLR